MDMDWGRAVAAVRPGWERRQGSAGRRAAEDLPARVARVAAPWDLSVLGPLAAGWESVVVAVQDASGRAGVLKCRPPSDPGTQREAMALQRLASPTLVDLIACAPDDGVLWLGRVVPGRALSQEPDDQVAVDAFCQVAGSLPRHAVLPNAGPPCGRAAPFPTLDGQLGALEAWQAALPTGEGRLTQRLVVVARRLADSTRARSLLHGDLHDANILAAGDGVFCAIDPKGIWGDPAYEPACFLMNRWTRSPAPPELMATAASLAERLRLKVGRVLGWTLVHTALSLAWSQEDGGVAAPAADRRWALLRQASPVIGVWEA